MTPIEDNYRKLVKDLEEAKDERDRLWAMYRDSKDRVLRLMVDKNNAFFELETERAAAKVAN